MQKFGLDCSSRVSAGVKNRLGISMSITISPTRFFPMSWDCRWRTEAPGCLRAFRMDGYFRPFSPVCYTDFSIPAHKHMKWDIDLTRIPSGYIAVPVPRKGLR